MVGPCLLLPFPPSVPWRPRRARVCLTRRAMAGRSHTSGSAGRSVSVPTWRSSRSCRAGRAVVHMLGPTGNRGRASCPLLQDAVCLPRPIEAAEPQQPRAALLCRRRTCLRGASRSRAGLRPCLPRHSRDATGCLVNPRLPSPPHHFRPGGVRLYPKAASNVGPRPAAGPCSAGNPLSLGLPFAPFLLRQMPRRNMRAW